MHALLLAAVLGPSVPFPITLEGEVCISGTAQCSPVLATLQADHTGNFAIIVLVQHLSGQLQWAADPATGRVGFLLGGVAPLTGTLSGGCATGTGAVPTPPPLRPYLSRTTLPVDFRLCLVP